MEKALENLSKQELIALLKKEKAAKSSVLKEEKTAKKSIQTQLNSSKKSQVKSKEKLTEYKKEVSQLQKENKLLKAQVEQFQRMLFGQKRERFENPDQITIPFQETEAQQKLRDDVLKKIVKEHEREAGKKKHPGRMQLPDNLPVKEVEIFPEGDISDMVCIGKEITEELDIEPAKFFITRYIRYKYAPKNQEGVIIGELPERVIDKGIPSVNLLTLITIQKYLEHQPLYRQRQMFKRLGVPIPASTLEGWIKKVAEKLYVLYDCLLVDIKSKGYLQVDETTIKILKSGKKGKCHTGYYWVHRDPIEELILFKYNASRSTEAAKMVLANFKGYLQSDAYGVYSSLAKAAEGDIILVACWAHARRKFDEAKGHNKQLATEALLYIQELYKIERLAKDAKMSPDEKKKFRLDLALPILQEFGEWLLYHLPYTTPSGDIGTAIRYAVNIWEELNAYLYDGNLNIDNNLIEQEIRPVALGRKNYLFAGSHDSAQRAAVIYSFLAMCKKHEVNPFDWLKYTLENISTINHKNVRDLYPHNFKKMIQDDQENQ